MQLSFFLVLLSFVSLGQLQRISLSGNVSFYIHEILILAWVLVTMVTERVKVKKKIQKLGKWILSLKPEKHLILALAVIFLLGWGNAFRLEQLSFTPFLYCVRYSVYILFFTLIYWTEPIDKKWWPKLIILLNFLWLGFGLSQFLIFPDSRDMMYLGWDNHIYRLAGTLYDPAFMGLILVWFWLWLVQQKWQEKWQEILMRLMLMLTTVAVFLTYNRASYLAWIVGVSTWIVILLKRKNRLKSNLLSPKIKKVMFAIGSIIVIGLVFILIPKPEGDSNNLLRTNSIIIRLNEGQKYFSSLKPSQLVLGRGLFIPTPYTAYWLPYQGSEVKLTAAFPDNFFILLFSFGGIIGAPIMIYFFIKVTKHIKISLAQVFPLWMAWLISAQFNNSAFQAFVWLSFGFYIISTNLKRQINT